MTRDEVINSLRRLADALEAGLDDLPDVSPDAAPLTDDEWDKYAAVLDIVPESDKRVPWVELTPAAMVTPPSSMAAAIGAKLGKAGRPRSDLDDLMRGSTEAELLEAVEAWRAQIPERRRCEGVDYQTEATRDGRVYAVKVAPNGFVTAMRADFPADFWQGLQVIDP